MSRKEDPADVDFTDARKSVCGVHQKMASDVLTIITTLRINGWWLKGLAGILGICALPFIGWLHSSEINSTRAFQVLESTVAIVEEQGKQLRELQSVSYGYQDSHKAAQNGSQGRL